MTDLEEEPGVPRDPELIQRDIERSRAALGHALDELVERAHPKNVAARMKESLRAKAETPAGKAAAAAVGAVVVLLVVKRIRNARKH